MLETMQVKLNHYKNLEKKSLYQKQKQKKHKHDVFLLNIRRTLYKQVNEIDKNGVLIIIIVNHEQEHKHNEYNSKYLRECHWW